MVEVHRLRVELGGKPLDVGLGDLDLWRFEAHADGEIVEPSDLCHDFASKYDATHAIRTPKSDGTIAACSGLTARRPAGGSPRNLFPKSTKHA